MEETRTLLITQRGGEETQIDIPVSWHVTFGPAAISASTSGMGDRKLMPMALRIYETEKQQRAIFTDVVSFRDMAIPVRVKVHNTQQKDGAIVVDGVSKRTTFQATTTEWKNPDDEEGSAKLLGMPSDTEIFNTTSEADE